MGFGFRIGYGYPWIIYSGKIRVQVLMGIDNWVSMGKLFRQGMGIPDPYPTHGHPQLYPLDEKVRKYFETTAFDYSKFEVNLKIKFRFFTFFATML